MDKKYQQLIKERPELFKNLSGGIDIITDERLISPVEKEHAINIGIIYQDEYMMLIKDLVRFSDGSIGPYTRVYHKNRGGVSIFVICEDKILLIKHFRHSLRSWMWETPRGFGEAGQTTDQNALRELHEEIGVVPTDIVHLGTIFPDAGIVGEQITLYCARIAPNSTITTETREGIDQAGLFTKDQLKAAILSGEITDGITISSLVYAELKGLI